MGRRFFLLSFVAVALLAAACGSNDDDPPAASSTAPGATTAVKVTGLVKDGQLTVGTELPAPPFFNGDDYDTLKDGFEYDLAAALAKKVGLSTVKVVNMPFTGIVAGQRCPCDIDFSQITITDERKKAVTFTVPYFDADQGVLVNKGFKVPDLATAKTIRWGAQASTTGFDKVKEVTGKEPQAYDTVTAAFAALKAKQIDAVMLDVPIVAGEAAQPGSTFEVVGKLPTGEQYGAIVPKDSPNLAAFNAAMSELKADGTVSTLLKKYFPAAASVPELK
jgi:polar amino acid transport system substrate-binding protein